MSVFSRKIELSNAFNLQYLKKIVDEGDGKKIRSEFNKIIYKMESLAKKNEDAKRGEMQEYENAYLSLMNLHDYLFDLWKINPNWVDISLENEPVLAFLNIRELIETQKDIYRRYYNAAWHNHSSFDNFRGQSELSDIMPTFYELVLNPKSDGSAVYRKVLNDLKSEIDDPLYLNINDHIMGWGKTEEGKKWIIISDYFRDKINIEKVLKKFKEPSTLNLDIGEIRYGYEGEDFFGQVDFKGSSKANLFKIIIPKYESKKVELWKDNQLIRKVREIDYDDILEFIEYELTKDEKSEDKEKH